VCFAPHQDVLSSSLILRLNRDVIWISSGKQTIIFQQTTGGPAIFIVDQVFSHHSSLIVQSQGAESFPALRSNIRVRCSFPSCILQQHQQRRSQYCWEAGTQATAQTILLIEDSAILQLFVTCPSTILSQADLINTRHFSFTS
jgi:hypothetical protein